MSKIVVFSDAKRIYEEISEECLKASLSEEGRENFGVYENILELCKKIISVASVVENEEDDIEEDDEEIKRLNFAIKRVYFSKKAKEDDYERNLCERAFLKKWEYGGDAYEDLKRFSKEVIYTKKIGYNEVVIVLGKVLDELHNSSASFILDKRIEEIFEPYKDVLK